MNTGSVSLRLLEQSPSGTGVMEPAVSKSWWGFDRRRPTPAIGGTDHTSARDPYMLSLELLVERFAMEMATVVAPAQSRPNAEARKLDRQLALAWET